MQTKAYDVYLVDESMLLSTGTGVNSCSFHIQYTSHAEAANHPPGTSIPPSTFLDVYVHSVTLLEPIHRRTTHVLSERLSTVSSRTGNDHEVEQDEPGHSNSSSTT